MKKFKICLSIMASLFILVSGLSCTGSNSDGGIMKAQERLVLATTTSLYDTGLWALLEPKFEAQYKVELDVLYAGTGMNKLAIIETHILNFFIYIP